MVTDRQTYIEKYNIGFVINGFGGGTAPVNYTTVGTGLDGGIGSGSLVPEVGSDEIASNNAAGIPDFVWKVPTADISTGLAFYESGDNEATISASNEAVSFVEKYYPPDNNKWGYFVGDISYKVVLTEDGSVIPISSHRSEGDSKRSYLSGQKFGGQNYRKFEFSDIFCN